MDTLTHLLVALILAEIFELKNAGKKALILGAIIIDLDHLFYFAEKILGIGNISTSLINKPLHNLAGALGLTLASTPITRPNTTLVLLGALTHLALDMLTETAGTRLLYPLSSYTITLPIFETYPIYAPILASIAYCATKIYKKTKQAKA